MKLVLSPLFVLGCAAIAMAGEPADSWPASHRPAGTGVAPPTADPPLHWDTTKNIRWKTELPGRGSATPIVWGDQVFVVTAVKTDRQAKAEELPKRDPALETKTNPPAHFYRFEVLSFDRQTGRPRWARTAAEAVPHEGHHPSHSYAAGSPTTDGKRLYVSFGSFGIYSYDLSGKLLWSRDLGRMNTRLGWGEAVTPVVHGDSLVLNWDQEIGSKLFVLDAATGKTRWKVAQDEKTSWNTPMVVEHRGRTQVIVNGTNRVRSYDLADGRPIWECGGMTVNAIPSPIAADGVAYVVSGYRGAAAIAVPLEATGEVKDAGQLIWRYTKAGPYVPSPLLVNNRLYFTHGTSQMLTILDAKTGKPVLTEERLPTVTSFYSSPVAAAGRIYLVDQLGTTLVLKQGDSAEVLATNKLNDPIDASPAIAGKQLFLRGAKYLYCIEEK